MTLFINHRHRHTYFSGGGIGYVTWNGTQHNPLRPRTAKGIPKSGAGTLAVIGDLKQMSPRWLVGTSILGYGVSLTVGIGVPIPVLSEEILQYTLVTDADILAPVVDYASSYPNREDGILGEVSYAQLKSGSIELQGKTIPAASLSSYPRAVEIAQTLKSWIMQGEFQLTEMVAPLPGPESGIKLKSLEERKI